MLHYEVIAQHIITKVLCCDDKDMVYEHTIGVKDNRKTQIIEINNYLWIT